MPLTFALLLSVPLVASAQVLSSNTTFEPRRFEQDAFVIQVPPDWKANERTQPDGTLLRIWADPDRKTGRGLCQIEVKSISPVLTPTLAKMTAKQRAELFGQPWSEEAWLQESWPHSSEQRTGSDKWILCG